MPAIIDHLDRLLRAGWVQERNDQLWYHDLAGRWGSTLPEALAKQDEFDKQVARQVAATAPPPALRPRPSRLSNAELLERLEAALHILQEVEAGMDGRPELADLQTRLCDPVMPTIGMMVDELHYSRPDVSPEAPDLDEEEEEGQSWGMEPH